ncbi:MAG TPA: VWA domain-containing protein [Pyrinomonadaceae bacterium]
MRSQSFVAAALVFALVFAPVAASAQQTSPTPTPQPAAPTSQEDVVRVATNLVQVDVVVTDKNGQQVTDLRPEDFEISENGKRQTVTHFSYVAAAEPQTMTATNTDASTNAASPSASKSKNNVPVQPARLRREQVRRTIALVVDDLGLSFESIGFVRKALKKFVDEQMQPNDLVAILRTSSGAGALQQFTSDKARLSSIVERIKWYPNGRNNATTSPFAPAQAIAEQFSYGPEMLEEVETNRAGIYAAGTLNSMGSIVHGLGELPGRKSLVFISEAFRLFSAQGRNERLLDAMRRLTDRANAASVSIYTMDASGLQTFAGTAEDRAKGIDFVFDKGILATLGGVTATPPGVLGAPRVDTSLSAQAERDSGAAFRRLNAMMDNRRDQQIETHTVMSYLAARTGGISMQNRNDLGAAMQRIMDDQRGYYLVGYRPDDASLDPATGRPRLRNLSVKVKRSGVTARTRASYSGFTDEDRRAKPRTREEQLMLALVSPFASGDVRLRLTSMFGTEPASTAPYVRSLVHIDARDLSFKEEANGARTTELDMVALAFGDNGQVVDQLSYPQTVRVENNEAHQRLLQSGLFYILNFPIPKAGAYQMRVAVRDASSERIGAATQFVEIPDLARNRLALSGIVLSGIQPAATTNTAAAAAATNTSSASTDTTPQSANAALEPDPLTGPAVRRLRQGMMIDYRYNIYGAQLDPQQGRPQLQTQMRLFREGQSAFNGKLMPLDVSQQRDMKRLSAIGRLRIGPELTPGEYVLQVTVTDTLAPKGRQTATQWIDFEIVN